VGGSYVDEPKRAAERPTALDDVALDWMLKRVKRHYPMFPFDLARTWKILDATWAEAPAHEARKTIYRAWPVAQRMSNNNVGQARRWRYERIVCHDRHADPIGEMIHISALLRLGQSVTLDGRTRPYRPWNLVSQLNAIEETYSTPAGGPRSGPDFLIVDWSGDPLSKDSSMALQLIRQAKSRLFSSATAPAGGQVMVGG
jgi:hypothetical protein